MNRPVISFNTRWLISRNADLVWLIGSVLAGWLIFFLHAGWHLDMLAVWFLWVTLLDTPHFFGTYSRTYLDRVEWRRRRRLLTLSLGWFLAGPLALAAGWALFRAGAGWYQAPFYTLLIAFNLWAYLHVVRQHFGLMRLYARKNEELNRTDATIDWWLLHAGLIAPFVAFAIRHPAARTRLGLPPEIPPWPMLGQAGARWSWEHLVLAATALVVVAAAVVFIARQATLVSRGAKLNGPKLLFLAAVVPFYAFVCYSPQTLTLPLLAFGALVTVSHDLQYHALVWFHHRNRYHGAGPATQNFGVAARISRHVILYFGCALAMSLVLRLLGCTLELTPGCSPVILTSGFGLFGAFTTRDLLLGVMIGFPMHHYFLDQFIWRSREDASLRKDLGLPA